MRWDGTANPSLKWCRRAVLMTNSSAVETYSPVSSSNILSVVPSRPVLSRRQKMDISSRAVLKCCIYRPVPSRENILTVPSRRQQHYLPSRSCVYGPAVLSVRGDAIALSDQLLLSGKSIWWQMRDVTINNL